MALRTPAINYQLIHYASLLAMFNSLHGITNQELFEKLKIATVKNTDDLGNPSCATAKSTPS